MGFECRHVSSYSAVVSMILGILRHSLLIS